MVQIHDAWLGFADIGSDIVTRSRTTWIPNCDPVNQLRLVEPNEIAEATY